MSDRQTSVLLAMVICSFVIVYVDLAIVYADWEIVFVDMVDSRPCQGQTKRFPCRTGQLAL